MTISALQYHNQSSYDRNHMNGHYLDWENQPSVFKEYQDIDLIPLPVNDRTPEIPFSNLIKEKYNCKGCREITLEDLSIILRLTYGVTARARHGGEYFYYRSSASAGALYPTEIYIVSQSVSDLDKGLYHFSVHRHGLTQIRTGDLSSIIIEASGTANQNRPLITFFLTAIFFRSSWKYRDRAYRYHLLDTGHVIENLLLSLKSLEIEFHLTYDFDDNRINKLLGLDESREVALAMIHIPGPETVSVGKTNKIPDLPEKFTSASRVSVKEVEYPIIREIVKSGNKVVINENPELDLIERLGINAINWERPSPPSSSLEILNYPEVVFKRRSRRNFGKRLMKKDYLLALIVSLYTNRYHFHGEIIQTAIILNDNLEGYAEGIYLLDTTRGSTSLVKKGSFTDQIAYISLSQDWLAKGTANFLFLTNLDIIDKTWGPRGYRYAMMTAGMMGERLYLASSSMGIGCCGIGAFHDHEASELIGLNAESKLLYFVVTGPVK